MNLNEEITIYKTRDEFGDIEVKDHSLIRSLYFGDDKKQSCMFMPEPAVLVLNYAQAMMSCLLFSPAPKRILLIGLGGGSLVHFLNKVCPDSKIEVAELRLSVIDIAIEYFKLPLHNRNLTIQHRDAVDYVAESVASNKTYDLVLVDAFDQWGPSEIISNREFLGQCKRLVGEKGICCFNLWNRRVDAYSHTLKIFEQTFAQNLFELRLGNINSNVILLGFNEKVNLGRLKNLENTAQILKRKFGVDFPRFHKMLVKQNSSIVKRLKASVFS